MEFPAPTHPRIRYRRAVNTTKQSTKCPKPGKRGQKKVGRSERPKARWVATPGEGSLEARLPKPTRFPTEYRRINGRCSPERSLRPEYREVGYRPTGIGRSTSCLRRLHRGGPRNQNPRRSTRIKAATPPPTRITRSRGGGPERSGRTTTAIAHRTAQNSTPSISGMIRTPEKA